MSIYQKLLGDSFERLHPKLQERYSFQRDGKFRGKGTMTDIRGARRWMYPFLLLLTRWKFIFPESGKHIPFEIKNVAYKRPDGMEEVKWERMFYFPQVTRRFHAFMTIDPARKVVKDYLGEPHLFYSDLLFTVTSEGGLSISSGSQKLIVGKMEIPIPSMFKGNVEVAEGFDDQLQVFTIEVKITNRLLGNLMTYKGYFSEVDG
ncbi:DUF4166 domain-containing protein [Alkalicoccobacillus gibsonii]|uniref:DUF4166 domain-containing protein n=1 Tax=Alkalicoccobacillus gibsonii TaxID=79881 RepID=UPI0019324C99|nr:DUF4166 domain-containing protein [Alkalicoccobacillus gibsonii]MBM0066495.1 DUF4166 domain-containing protein [Alkalicoccobacillus gibsonii]